MSNILSKISTNFKSKFGVILATILTLIYLGLVGVVFINYMKCGLRDWCGFGIAILLLPSSYIFAALSSALSFLPNTLLFGIGTLFLALATILNSILLYLLVYLLSFLLEKLWSWLVNSWFDI